MYLDKRKFSEQVFYLIDDKIFKASEPIGKTKQSKFFQSVHMISSLDMNLFQFYRYFK